MTDQPQPMLPQAGGVRRSTQTRAGSQATADTVFTSTLQSMSAKVDCDLFLQRKRRFGASLVKIALHPCYQKAGQENEIITIGCAAQGGEGVTITPEYEYADIENQCPSAMEQRISKTTYKIEIDVNETGFARQDLMGLIWNLGEAEEVSHAGSQYRQTKFGIQSNQLPIYVVSIQPVTPSGEPVDGVITFYRAQWTPEPGELKYSRDGTVSSKISFNALYDQSEEAIGHMLVLL